MNDLLFSWIEKVAPDIWATAGALIVTIIAGVVALGAQRFQSRTEESARGDIDDIAKAAAAKSMEARSKALLALAEKLPSGLTAEKFEEAFGQQVSIGRNLIIGEQTKEGGELVEDLINSYHHQALSQARV